MDIIKKLIPRYCTWFVVFCKKVVRSRNRTLFLYGILGAIKDFSNIAAFFIPLKLIMVLSNPDILSSNFFTLGSMDLEKFIVYSAVLFFLLVFVSLMCHLVLAVFMHKSAKLLWAASNSTEFPSRTKYQNLYQVMVDTITHVLIITAGLVSVLFLDKYLFIPIVIIIVSCVVASKWLSGYTKENILASPLKNPRLVFKLLADLGFSLTFVFIIIEYYFDSNINLLYTLLAVLMSRIIFRNILQLFVKHRKLFEDYYIERRC
jgi:hypothetical protein